MLGQTAEQPSKFPIVITASMLSDGGSCEELFHKRFVRRIVPEKPSIHLVAGASFAEGLKRARIAFYKNGKTEDEALLDGTRGIIETWEINEPVEYGTKNIGSIILALDYYLTTCPLSKDALKPADFGNGNLGIEFNFSIPLPIRHPDTNDFLLYEGRCDMLSFVGKSLVIVDEKTTTQLGNSWSSQFSLRSQFMGYCWAAQQYGYDTNIVYVRQIAIRKKDFELAEIPILFSPTLVDRWYCQTLLKKVTRLVTAYKNEDYEYDFAEHCTTYGGCSFVDVCKQIETKEIPVGFKQVEKLYFEK